MTFSERYYDPGLEFPASVIREDLIKAQLDRILRSLTLAVVVGSIPRRLGTEATDEELALDKRRARRVSWALLQAYRAWNSKEPKIQVTPELEREGNQLEWDIFVIEHTTQIADELRTIVTWSIQKDDGRWGRTAVVNLENEIRWITYAMRS
jgi:hypothetical protein